MLLKLVCGWHRTSDAISQHYRLGFMTEAGKLPTVRRPTWDRATLDELKRTPLGKSSRCCRRQIVVRDSDVTLQTCCIVKRLFIFFSRIVVIDVCVSDLHRIIGFIEIG